MTQPGNKLSRRDLLRYAAGTGVGVLAAPMLNLGRFRLFANSPAEYSARAIELVGRSTVIDMLSVLTLDFAKGDRWMADPATFTAADFQPFKDSGLDIIHPAIGIGGPSSYE